MGLEKVLKNLPLHLHSSNAFPLSRKVGFAFSLGLVVSLLILTEIVLKTPLKYTSSFNPVYGGFNGFTINSSSSFSNTSVSSSLELQNSTDFLQRNVDEGVKKTLHENESSLSKSEALMENTNDVTERVTEKPKMVKVRRKKRLSKKARKKHLPGKGNFEGFYNDSGPLKRLFDSSGKCDIFDGKWVRDPRKPLYPSGSCPYIATSFNCYLHGRPDNDFLRWKWKPNGCDIPRLNATDFLERLRGKRMVFVGDSLNRNMWVSLVCILRNSIEDKKRVYSVSGRTKYYRRGISALRFEDYNCSIGLAFSPFLVRKSYLNGSKIETLRLDLMDWRSPMYREADVLVFNTAHWWTDSKTSKGENFYRMGDYVYPKLQVLKAYRKGLATWAKWVDNNINSNRTLVFFRGMSLTHYRGGQWNSGGHCHKETKPIFNENYLDDYPPKMKIVERVLQKMKTPVLYLNISRLTDYRKDGHPSIYRMDYNSRKERIESVKIQDCSHWCLPGVPDTWNELFYASLLMSGKLEKDHGEIDQIITQNQDNVM